MEWFPTEEQSYNHHAQYTDLGDAVLDGLATPFRHIADGKATVFDYGVAAMEIGMVSTIAMPIACAIGGGPIALALVDVSMGGGATVLIGAGIAEISHWMGKGTTLSGQAI